MGCPLKTKVRNFFIFLRSLSQGGCVSGQAASFWPCIFATGANAAFAPVANELRLVLSLVA